MRSLRQVITENFNKDGVSEGISPAQFKDDLKNNASANYDKDLHKHAQRHLTGDTSHIGTDESRAIQTWTNPDGYKLINGYNRGINSSPKGKKLSEDLSRAIENHPLPNGVWAYRGVHGPHADKLATIGPGDTFHNEGFASTTLDPKRATHFARGRDILAVHLPKGSPAFYVSHPEFNGHTSEREMLLPSQTHFRYSHHEDIHNVPVHSYDGRPTGETKSIRLHHVELIPPSKGSIALDK